MPVRVGQAVDVVAQAGRPKSITGKRVWRQRPHAVNAKHPNAAARLTLDMHS